MFPLPCHLPPSWLFRREAGRPWPGFDLALALLYSTGGTQNPPPDTEPLPSRYTSIGPSSLRLLLPLPSSPQFQVKFPLVFCALPSLAHWELHRVRAFYTQFPCSVCTTINLRFDCIFCQHCVEFLCWSCLPRPRAVQIQSRIWTCRPLVAVCSGSAHADPAGQPGFLGSSFESQSADACGSPCPVSVQGWRQEWHPRECWSKELDTREQRAGSPLD